jgi:hypothetical protein
MYVAKKFPLVIIFSFLFAFKPLPKNSDSYSKNMSQENLEVLNKKSCSTEKNSFNNIQPDEFPSVYSRQRDRNVEIPINYHVIYVAGDSIYMNVTVDNQNYPHCSWDIRDYDNNTFLLYPGFEFDYPGHSYSIGGILPPGNYSLFLYDEFGTGGVSATVTTSSGQVLASVNQGSWGNYTFLDFTAPDGDYMAGLVSTETIEQQTAVLNNAYNDFGYTFITSNIDSAVNAGWYYATDSHKFETGQWNNTDQYLTMAQAMTIDVTHSINYFWTGARLTSGLGVHPWSFPEDDSRHGLFCGNYTIPGGEPGLNLGITGVHEVGHYLGLYHIFENGCSTPGDEVDDTPDQIEPNYLCPTSNYSCGSFDDIGNYMDYMDDDCLTHFTQGQKDRIDWAIETYRPILLENTTVGYTGPVWHVATTGSDGTGDGSEENPFATIQKGVDISADGDTVLVHPGTYEPVSNVGSIFLISAQGPEQTTIDANFQSTAVHFGGGDILISGFTITGGNAYYTNQYMSGSGYHGGGIGGNQEVFNFGDCNISNMIFVNNIIDINLGVDTGDPDSIMVSHSTFIRNENNLYAIESLSHPLFVMNCIFVSDVNISSSNEIINNEDNNGVDPSISYSLFFPDTNNVVHWQGFNIGNETNLLGNPLFCDPENGDYFLAGNSPAIGAGEGGSNIGALGVGCDAFFLPPIIENIADQQTNEDVPLTVNISASSQMGSALTYVVESDTSAMPVYMDGSSVAIGLQVNWNGEGTVTVTVTDEGGLSDTTSFQVTVMPVNDSPEAFTVIYPTVSDTFSTHVDNNTAIPFNWQESHDVDSDVTYKLTIELEFFGNTYTDVHENITDTTISVSSNSLDPLLNVISQDIAPFTYYIDASDEEYTMKSDTGTFVLSRISLSTINKDIVPETFALHQNYPNPFNPITSISYDLPQDGLVNITVYDMMGREVKNLVNDMQTAGFRSVMWDGTNNNHQTVSAGLYIYSIYSDNYIDTKKMILLK